MPEHTPRVEIACCPEHGLHGNRHDCFICGGPVERVPMVPAAELDAAHAAIRGLLRFREGHPAIAYAHAVLARGVLYGSAVASPQVDGEARDA